MGSDFGTPQSHAIKNESCVISKGWCVWGALSPGFIIPPDMMMIVGSAVFCLLDSLVVALDLMLEIYIVVNLFV